MVTLVTIACLEDEMRMVSGQILDKDYDCMRLCLGCEEKVDRFLRVEQNEESVLCEVVDCHDPWARHVLVRVLGRPWPDEIKTEKSDDSYQTVGPFFVVKEYEGQNYSYADFRAKEPKWLGWAGIELEDVKMKNILNLRGKTAGKDFGLFKRKARMREVRRRKRIFGKNSVEVIETDEIVLRSPGKSPSFKREKVKIG